MNRKKDLKCCSNCRWLLNDMCKEHGFNVSGIYYCKHWEFDGLLRENRSYYFENMVKNRLRNLETYIKRSDEE